MSQMREDKESVNGVGVVWQSPGDADAGAASWEWPKAIWPFLKERFRAEQ